MSKHYAHHRAYSRDEIQVRRLLERKGEIGMSPKTISVLSVLKERARRPNLV